MNSWYISNILSSFYIYLQVWMCAKSTVKCLIFSLGRLHIVKELIYLFLKRHFFTIVIIVIFTKGNLTNVSNQRRFWTSEIVDHLCMLLDFFLQLLSFFLILLFSILFNILLAGESSFSCSNCGTPCVLRTANTTNNRGRKFYKCQSQECNFFAYAASFKFVLIS